MCGVKTHTECEVDGCGHSHDEPSSLEVDATKMILVWAFEDAPEAFKALSTNGGDEDWLALVPYPLQDKYIGWLESQSFSTDGEPEKHETEFGIVYIGSHA